MNKRIEAQFDGRAHFPLGNASSIFRSHIDRDHGEDAKRSFALGIKVCPLYVRRKVPGVAPNT